MCSRLKVKINHHDLELTLGLALAAPPAAGLPGGAVPGLFTGLASSLPALGAAAAAGLAAAAGAAPPPPPPPRGSPLALRRTAFSQLSLI